MSLSHVAEDSALRNEDDATGYRAETAWLRLMPHEDGVAGDRRDCRSLHALARRGRRPALLRRRRVHAALVDSHPELHRRAQ